MRKITKFLSVLLFIFAAFVVVGCQGKKFDVTFDLNGGNVSGSTEAITIKIDSSKLIDESLIPAPLKEGHEFIGWKLDGEDFKFEEFKVDKAITLKAEWKANPIKVTFDVDGKLEVVDKVYGDKLAAPTNPEKAGFTFKHWTLDGVVVEFPLELTKDVKLVAVFEEIIPDTVTITFVYEDKSVIETVTVEVGTEVSLPTAPEKDHYKFLGWFDGEMEVVAAFQATTSKEIVAKYGANEYTVTFELGEGLDPITSKALYNTEINTPEEPTKEHHKFLGWFDGETKVEFPYLVLGNKTLTAKWEVITYQVTFEGAEVEALTVNSGTAASEPVAPEKAGHTFVEWQLNGMKYDFTSLVTSDITLVAVFTVNNYAVTIPSEVVLVTEGIDLTKVAYGTQLDFNVNVAEGKYLVEVKAGEENLVFANNQFELTVAKDVVITVRIEISEAIIAEVDAELASILDTMAVKLPSTEEVTIELVKQAIIVNTDIVDLEVSGTFPTFTVKLSSVFVEYETSKEITVTRINTYEVTITEDFEVVLPVGLILTEVEQNQEVTFKVIVPEFYIIDKVMVGETEVTVDETNQFVATITSSVAITATFKLDPSIVSEVQTELDKIPAEVILTGVLEVGVARLVEQVGTLVNLELVSVSATIVESKATITLTSTKTNLVTLSKEVDVDVERVTLTIDLNGGETPEGVTELIFSIPKGFLLTRELIGEVTKAGNFIQKFIIVGETPVEVLFNQAITEDTSLQAVWVEGYTVSFDSSEATNTLPVQYVIAGELVVAPINTLLKPGYYSASWQLNGVDFAFDTEVITSNITLTPVWQTYLKYHEVDGQIVIDGLTKSVPVVELPTTIDSKPVVAISDRSFYHGNFETFIGNEGLKEIGHLAFEYVYTLKNVTLPSTLEVIGNYAFGRTGITSITIPFNVKVIGHQAFNNTSSLETVVFANPDFLQINNEQFDGSKWLNTLKANEAAQGFVIVNNVLIYAYGEFTDGLVIPEGVRRIGNRVFMSSNATQVTFNAELEEIGISAFQNSKVGELVFPKSLKVIGHRAFYRTNLLNTVTFVDGGNDAIVIGERAFEDSGVVSFDLPNKLQVLSVGVFQNATRLETINVVENNVTTIKKLAFAGTKWLQTQQTENPYVSFNNILFDASMAQNTSLFPAEVTQIAEWAFANTPSLTSVSIPATVKLIRTHAFFENMNLVQLSINGAVEVIENKGITAYGPQTLIVTVSDIDAKPEAWGDTWLESRQAWAARLVPPTKLIWSPVVTVRFALVGGETEYPIEDVVISQGQLVPEPEQTPTREGYVFLGWFLGSEYFYFETDILTRSVELSAGWLPVSTDYEFEVINGKAKLIKWINLSSTEVVVPETIGVFPVDEIYENAFAGVTNLTSVTLPSSLVKVGANAFAELSQLATITYGTELKEFGRNAFANTAWLAAKQQENALVIINNVLVSGHAASGAVVVPGTVLVVEAYAFENNVAMTSLTVSEGTTLVKEYAVKGASALAQITLPHSLRVVEKHAFATGSTVAIDATLVNHVKPVGYPENWVDEFATVTWLAAVTYSVTVPESIKALDHEVVYSSIIENTAIEFKITIPQFKHVTKLMANEVDLMSTLDENKEYFTYTVVADATITVEFDFLPELIAEIDQEFAKVDDKIGVETTNAGLQADLTAGLTTLLNAELVKYTVEAVEGETQKFLVRVISIHTDDLYREKVVEVQELMDVNSLLTHRSQSGQAASAEHGRYMIDNNRLTSKWCDNGGSVVKFVTFELGAITPIGKVTINHAGVNEEKTFNTANFKIEVSLDNVEWTTVVDVVGNTETQTAHTFPFVDAKFIKFSSTKGAQDGHVTRIYDFRVYGTPETANVTLDYNGGKYGDGETQRTFKTIVGAAIPSNKIPTIFKDYYSLDGWKTEAGEAFSLQTVIQSDVVLYAQWVPQPNVIIAINGELNKIFDPTVAVAAVQNEPTLDEIKARIEEVVDLEKVVVSVANFVPGEGEEEPTEPTYTITLAYKLAPEIMYSRNIVVYTREEGETVNVVFNLNGGNVDGNTENITFAIDKGAKFAYENIPNALPKTEYYEFVDWKLNDAYAVIPTIIFLADHEFVAEWKVIDQVKSDVNAQLQKVTDSIAVISEGETPTNAEIVAAINGIVNTEHVSVVVTPIDGEANRYTVKLISTKVGEDYTVEKAVNANKGAKMTTEQGVTVVGTQDPTIAVVGVETTFKIAVAPYTEVDVITVDGVEQTLVGLDEFVFTPTADFTVVVTFKVDIEASTTYLNQILAAIPAKVLISTFFEDYPITDVETALGTYIPAAYFNIEVTTREGMDQFTVKVTHNMEETITGSKDFATGGISDVTGTFEIIEDWTGYDNGGWDTGYKLISAVDKNADGSPKLDTSWKSTNGNTFGTAYHPRGEKFFLTWNPQRPLATEMVITLAGGMPGGNPADNNTDFDVKVSGTNYDWYLKNMVTVKQVRGNTSNQVRIDLGGIRVGTIYITFKDNIPAQIADITLYGEAPVSYATFNPEGGTIDGLAESKTVKLLGGSALGTAIPTPELLNHTFVKFVNAAGEDVTAETVINGNATYTAVYERSVTPETSHAITFDLAGGLIGESSANVVVQGYDQELLKYGLVGEIPANPTKENYTFVGWFNGEEEFTLNQVITAPATYTAKWVVSDAIYQAMDTEIAKLEDQYTVILEDGVTELTLEAVQALVLSKVDQEVIGAVTVEALADNNYKLTFTHKVVLDAVKTRELKVFGVLSTDKVTVTFDFNSGVSEVESETSRAVEIIRTLKLSAEQIPTVTKDLYDFTGWYLNDVLVDLETMHFEESVTLLAKFEKKPSLVAEYNTEVNKIKTTELIAEDFVETDENVATLLNSKVSSEIVTLVIEKIAEKQYKVVFTSVKFPDLTEEKTVKLFADLNSRLSFVAESYSVNESENGSMMIDADRTGTKWCDNDASITTKFVTFKFAEANTIGKITINHAEAGMENPLYNTVNFYIEVSMDGEVWTKIVDVTGNTAGMTNHEFELVEAVYVKFTTTKAAQWQTVSRVYDFRVFGLN